MTNAVSTPLTALIVHAHPEPESFSSAQAQVARQSLLALGYQVKTIDLYDRGWNPVLDRTEFPQLEGPFKPQREQWHAVKSGALADDVQSDLDALMSADLLVLSFPLWWFSLPSILKGWIDRVFVMGATFGGDLGLFGRAGLAGRRAVVLTTTGGDSASFRSDGEFGDMSEFLYHVHRGMLEFVGYAVLNPIVTFGPARLDDSARHDALNAVSESFSAIDSRPHVSTAGALSVH